MVENVAWSNETPIEKASWRQGYIAIDLNRMDRWLDEDDEIFGHIRDPCHRVDARPTSRHVQVRIAGTRVAGHWCFDGPEVEVNRIDGESKATQDGRAGP